MDDELEPCEVRKLNRFIALKALEMKEERERVRLF